MNLRTSLHADKEACKWGVHPGFQTQSRRHQEPRTGFGVSGPTNKIDVPKTKKMFKIDLAIFSPKIGSDISRNLRVKLGCL